jgi:hypothetical protein
MAKGVALLVALWLACPAVCDAKLVFQRPGSKAIVVARNDGSHRHVVSHGSAPAVSPNGKWVAFFRSHRFSDSLHVVSAAGGKPRKLMGGATPMQPLPVVWNPDGRRLLTSNDIDAAFLFNVERGTKHRYDLRDNFLSGGAFSPDGSRLVLAYGGTDREDPTLRLIRIGRKQRQVLWPGYNPVWGPTGIAAAGSPHLIRFAHAPGEAPHVIAHAAGSPVGVSGNGRRILVGEGSPFVPNHALLVDPITMNAHRLSRDFQTVNGLSRDGRHILGVIDGAVVDVQRDGHVKTLAEDGTQPSWTK